VRLQSRIKKEGGKSSVKRWPRFKGEVENLARLEGTGSEKGGEGISREAVRMKKCTGGRNHKTMGVTLFQRRRLRRGNKDDGGISSKGQTSDITCTKVLIGAQEGKPGMSGSKGKRPPQTREKGTEEKRNLFLC